MTKRSRDEDLDEPIHEGLTHLSDQRYQFWIDCSASPESAGSIRLQSERSGQHWYRTAQNYPTRGPKSSPLMCVFMCRECQVQNADDFSDDTKGIPRPMVLKVVARVLESTSGSKKARKPVSMATTFLPAQPGDGEEVDSRVFELILPLQVQVEGVLWQPKYRFPMQPVVSEPSDAKIRAVERENAKLKKELAAMKQLKERTDEDSNQPMTTRRSAKMKKGNDLQTRKS